MHSPKSFVLTKYVRKRIIFGIILSVFSFAEFKVDNLRTIMVEHQLLVLLGNYHDRTQITYK